MNTVFDLETASAQQVAEHIVRHLLTQKKRAYKGARELCVLINSRGERCAAGSLLNDAGVATVSAQHIEASGWGSLINQGLVPDTHHYLVGAFQHVHDWRYPEDWRVECKRVLDEYDLDASFMDSIP